MSLSQGAPVQYLVVAGVVVLGLAGVFVAWRLAKSLLSLLFWFFVLAALIAGAGWLLERAQLLPAW